MKDKELKIDRIHHVLYTGVCKKEIRKKIALHCAHEEREAVWERVQLKYAEFLSDWRTDLGGKKNFHNGRGGNYDCIALMAYYVVCKDFTSLAEIEEMEGNLFLGAFRKMKFVDCNKPFFRKLMYKAFENAKRQCDKWGDFKMNIARFDEDKPIYYEFTECPTAEFAKKHGLLEVMPALCNPDFEAMECVCARLVCKTTCANGCRCDYTIVGDGIRTCRLIPNIAMRRDIGEINNYWWEKETNY